MKVSHLHSSCQRLTAHVDQDSNAVPVGEAGSEVTDDGLESLTVLPQLSFCFAQGEREPPDLCLADGMLAGRPTGKSVPASTVSAASVKALRAACRSSSSPLSSKCPHGRAHSRAAREGVLGPSHTAVDTGHGRRVRRTIRVVDAPTWIEFPGAAQVAQIRRTIRRARPCRGIRRCCRRP